MPPYLGTKVNKAILFLCGVSLVSVFGQGVIRFETDLGAEVDAPVFLPGFAGGPGPDFSAQLFILSESSLTPLSPATNFRFAGSGVDAVADRYVNPIDVTVPDHPPGSSVTLVMRVWRTSAGSYDHSDGCARGQSAPFTITLGGGDLPPAPLTGLFSFILGHLGCFPPPWAVIAAISIQNGQAIVTAIQTTENTRLQGTRDLHTWTNLASTTAVVAGATRTFTVDAPESYQYYRLVQ